MQVEGAFLQGYGLFTLEETLHSPSGHLLARGPGAYKIPGFGDCPKEFNVHLLRNSENDKAIFLSKVNCFDVDYLNFYFISLLRI